MSYFDIYLWTVLFKLPTALALVTIAISTVTLVSGVVVLAGEGGASLARKVKILLITSIASILLCVITPSKDDAKLIIAAGTVAKVVENKDVQRVAGKSLQVVEKWLDESAKESK